MHVRMLGGCLIRGTLSVPERLMSLTSHAPLSGRKRQLSCGAVDWLTLLFISTATNEENDLMSHGTTAAPLH